MTRVITFKTSRDVSGRVFPENRRQRSGFHAASHHGGNEERILEFNKINRYHMSLIPYFFEKLADITEGDTHLLDKTLIVCGSPMGDSEPAQPQALPALPGRRRERAPGQGRQPHQGAGRNADGERPAERDAHARHGRRVAR